jgi:hypothetical protein
VLVFPFAFHIAVQQPLKSLWSHLLLCYHEPSQPSTVLCFMSLLPTSGEFVSEFPSPKVILSLLGLSSLGGPARSLSSRQHRSRDHGEYYNVEVITLIIHLNHNTWNSHVMCGVTFRSYFYTYREVFSLCKMGFTSLKYLACNLYIPCNIHLSAITTLIKVIQQSIANWSWGCCCLLTPRWLSGEEAW